MARGSRRTIICSVALAIMLAFPQWHAAAATPTAAEPDLPSLAAFTRSLVNGEPGRLRGVYVPGMLADVVVQQPVGHADFISPRNNVLTQYSSASELGSIGLLAHNYLAGSKFSGLQDGNELYLVYGDGQVSRFVVRQLFTYRAVEPNSPASSFIDLQDGRRLTSSALFSLMYGRPGHVVLQTCIASDGLSTWGRLFIVAEYAPARGTTVTFVHGL